MTGGNKSPPRVIGRRRALGNNLEDSILLLQKRQDIVYLVTTMKRGRNGRNVSKHRNETTSIRVTRLEVHQLLLEEDLKRSSWV
jgi:hypothetical protein